MAIGTWKQWEKGAGEFVWQKRKLEVQLWGIEEVLTKDGDLW